MDASSKRLLEVIYTKVEKLVTKVEKIERHLLGPAAAAARPAPAARPPVARPAAAAAAAAAAATAAAVARARSDSSGAKRVYTKKLGPDGRPLKNCKAGTKRNPVTGNCEPKPNAGPPKKRGRPRKEHMGPVQQQQQERHASYDSDSPSAEQEERLHVHEQRPMSPSLDLAPILRQQQQQQQQQNTIPGTPSPLFSN